MALDDFITGYSIFSRSGRKEKKRIAQYLTRFIGHPDPRSEFGRKVAVAKYFFRLPVAGAHFVRLAFPFFNRRGHDVLVAQESEGYAGFVAYQSHPDNTLRVYSVQVEKPYRNQGVSVRMAREVVLEARNLHRERVRFGKGGHESMEHVIEHLMGEHAAELMIVKEPDNWLRLTYPSVFKQEETPSTYEQSGSGTAKSD